MDNKKYYYLKLKDNFFDSDAMIVLESMPDGYLYSNILLKLFLRSLKNEGKLMFNDRIPYNSTILSQVVRHNVGVVEKALEIFKNLDLIEVMDNGAIYILDIQNFIGSSSSEADRIRKYRSQVDNERHLINEGVQMLQQKYDKSTPELEIELELEKEKELEKELKKELKKKKYSPETEEILTFLNLKSGSGYKLIDSNLKLIDSILKKGYTVEDCYTVINKKVEEWRGTEYEQYLRPITLFGSKFDGYLNAPINKKKSEFQRTHDKLEQLYEKYGGEDDEQRRNSKNIFDI